METSGIYKIINGTNNKYYVGSSYNVFRRWKKHRSYLRKNSHPNDYLQNAWLKHGEDTFRFEIIEEVKRENLDVVEQKYLDIAKQQQNLSYNLAFDASCPTRNMSEKTRQKMSEKAIEKFKDPAQRLKLSIAKRGIPGLSGKDHPMFGRTHTPEARALISAAMKKRCGRKNPCYNGTVYKFRSEITGEAFNGTMYDFTVKYNLSRGNVTSLTKGQRYSTKGWIYEGEN